MTYHGLGEITTPAWVHDARLIDAAACPDGYQVTGKLLALYSGTERIHDGSVICSPVRPFESQKNKPDPCGGHTKAPRAAQATLRTYITYKIADGRLASVVQGSPVSETFCFAAAKPVPGPITIQLPIPVSRQPPAKTASPQPQAEPSKLPVALLVGGLVLAGGAIWYFSRRAAS